MKYSVGFKESVVRKILPPGERSALSVAKELGISYQTVRNWLTLAKNGTLGGTDSGGALSRPVREKFNLLIQSQSIADSEKGLWLREHGLHSEHLTMYEQELREFMENKSTGDKEENRRLRLENKRLTKELQKKEKALAEMAALYTLKKKSGSSLGGGRGRLIAVEKRSMAVELIEEACESGARLGKACEVLEISVSTFRRWASGDLHDKRKGASKKIPRKLTDAEIQEILAVCCSKEYEDDSPCTIHASLLDKGRYVASVSSFYRVLREANLIKHRRNSKPGKKQSRPPELKATGPNQVWTWDITWLKTEVRGLYYYGYTIIDIWDRSIVKWAIHDREDEKLARELFDLALRDEKLPHVHVHSDNGNPMKGMTLLAFFHDLGISTSFSRARVSDDNPFIESWFKTLKYDVSFPKAFKSIGDARLWLANFVAAYNSSHRHSGLHYMTPLQVRKGEYGETARKRNETMKAANCKNPQRWSQGVKQLPLEHCVYLNPTAETRLKIQQISAKQVA